MAKTSTVNLYNIHVKQLQKLLTESKKQKDPAYWLYLNKARKPLFMLESIALIVSRTTEDKKTTDWLKFFKKLEDVLGEIDHYDVLVKEFSAKKAIRKELVDYYKKKLEKILVKFNKKLVKREFYIPRLKEFANDNHPAFTKTLILKIKQQIINDVNAAALFFKDYAKGFHNFEEQVHELRRKIRWASIYGESLGGIIILKDTSKLYTWEKEFVTKEVLNSDFNKLPVRKGFPEYIHFNKKAFYALSYAIGKLGEIKDKGLSIEALSKSLEKTGTSKTKKPFDEASRMLGTRESEEDLLKQAHALLTKYYSTYKIHQELFKV
ncbi:MAG: hypothetical protein K0S32_3766 [Bacteroidetes bacterium]|jgi:hypothetical protein|nr:hypothetical protein [Bacteroidota bacterium]